MTRLSSAVLPAAAVLALSTAAPARADSLSCTTVNGQTHCARGSSSTSCITVDSHTECHSDADRRKSNPPAPPPRAAPPDDEDQPDQEDRQDDDKPDASPTPRPRV
ncbi:MAG TPA: hypothetical protein VF113_02340 [Stellaceae bacterium]